MKSKDKKKRSRPGKRIFGGIRARLISIFLTVKLIPLLIIFVIAWQQFSSLNTKLMELSNALRSDMNYSLDEAAELALRDSEDALTKSATEQIERMTTDAAGAIADFLYGIDAEAYRLANDAALLADSPKLTALLQNAADNKTKRVVERHLEYELQMVTNHDGVTELKWVSTKENENTGKKGMAGTQTNPQNNDEDSWHSIPGLELNYVNIPLFDEIAFIDTSGMVQNRVTPRVYNGADYDLYKKTNYELYPLAPASTSMEWGGGVDLERGNIFAETAYGTYKNTYLHAEKYPDYIENYLFAYNNEGMSRQAIADYLGGELYVSDVVGASVGANYIGMFEESKVFTANLSRMATNIARKAAGQPVLSVLNFFLPSQQDMFGNYYNALTAKAVGRDYNQTHLAALDAYQWEGKNPDKPDENKTFTGYEAYFQEFRQTYFSDLYKQTAYAGGENPLGQRFEGIIRWVAPVWEDETLLGFVSLALNHDHIMEFVDHLTPMLERYVEIPSAYEGNYAFIWDYMCRSIAHPRHNSITGYDPVTGLPEVPWLETSIYNAWTDAANYAGFNYEKYDTPQPPGSTVYGTFINYINRNFEWSSFVSDPYRMYKKTDGAYIKLPCWAAKNYNNPNDSSVTATGYFEVKYDESKGEAYYMALSPFRSFEIYEEKENEINADESVAPANKATAIAKAVADAEAAESQRIPFYTYAQLQAEGLENLSWPTFNKQRRTNAPALDLTAAGNVALDGRYLNNAPQCTGWMNLTANGGSGSFYILWSGLYKLTTAGAIPYYTGMYAPRNNATALYAANGNSYRGFAMVTIGAGFEDFKEPARISGVRLGEVLGSARNSLDTSVTGTQDLVQVRFNNTVTQLAITTAIIIIIIVLIAIVLASSIAGNLARLNRGVERFRLGERQFRFNTTRSDEFGDIAVAFDNMADSIVDSVKSPLAITDNDKNIIYMNDKGLDLCRNKLENVTGSSYYNTSIYPKDSPYDPIKALNENRESEIFYLSHEDHYYRGHANYFYDKNRQQIGYIVESADLTDMVVKQMQIEQQRMLLDQVFASSPDLIWFMNADSRYLIVNPRFAAIAGQPPEDFVNKTGEDILPAAIAQRFIENDKKALNNIYPFYAEETVLFADGHEEILESVRTPIFDSKQRLVGLLGVARNISVRAAIEKQLRETQTELEKAVEEANLANRHKGDFLARMSHEIRTPMNAIIGLTKIVTDKLHKLDGKGVKLDDVTTNVSQIEGSSQHLLGLLNDILDISKIEAGKIELSEETVDLTRLINTVANIIKPRCNEKDIMLNRVFDEFNHCMFTSDSLRLRQVLINLLGNAVKFTPECGQIDFIVTKVEEREGRTLVRFSVRDTGIGISKDRFESIFKPFEQANSKISKSYGGTGLGLSISQRIVELFGGKIEVNSEIGKGSEFSFSIWLTNTEAELSVYKEISDVKGKFSEKRILLVDDVEINRMIVSSILENTGVKIDEAADGEAAYLKFANSPKHYYDVILMDIAMPNWDGYQSTEAIRALDRPDAKSVPIVALTANAFKEDIDRAVSHGMNAHIAKPIEYEILIEILFRFLG